MIKTPVSVGSVGTSNYHASSCYPLLIDANFKPLSNGGAKEAAKRINMHDELVKSLRDMFELAGMAHYNKDWSDRYLTAEKLLERCK